MIDVEEAYRQYGPMVLRRCRRLLRNDAQALDAMQDVFVEVLRRRETLDDRAPSALFMRVATNVCLNRLRHARRHPEDRDDELLLRIAAEVPDGESRSAARRLLDGIFGREPESTLAIAVMHYVDRMTLEEVAEESGLSVSGVRKRLRTLRARLAGETAAEQKQDVTEGAPA
jgi:RNA polymerase sigma-70 factor (ECF subfamily)